MAIAAIRSVVTPVARRLDHAPTPQLDRLGTLRAVAVALVAGLLAWVLPGVALWRLAHVWGHPFGLADAEYVYALSATLTGLTLIPGGIVVAGREMLTGLAAYGLPYGSAVLTVLAVRFATAGISVALGAVMVWIQLRTRPTALDHFDEIAEAYDAQIPETRQQDLLVRKTVLMAEALRSRGDSARGLDVGCGQGKYVERMRTMGFDVVGIDSSGGQVRRAARHLADPRIVTIGSVLEIPAADASYDFVYTINVLHHLPSIVEQRRAFQELLRVLKPGGLLFVHEINTRNALFRFYMGYVFPSLNCIDEGVERWLLPNQLNTYVDMDLVDVKYFTFLPEFVPRPIVRWLTPLERLLEGSPLGVYSAHYMATFRKKSAGPYGRG
jgi:ubiquinone/menaquinone biosynthesis C-methylase UbiE